MKRILLSILAFLTIISFCAQGKNASLAGKQFAPGRVLIKFKAPSNGTLRKFIPQSQVVQSTLQKIGAVAQKAVFANSYSTLKRQRIAEEIGLNRWVEVTVPIVTDMEKLINQLKRDPNVEIAEPNYLEKINASPNDPLYSSQQHLPQIKASQAWDVLAGDTTVIIAIIDTGVDWDHPDLAANIWNNPTPGDTSDIRGWDFVDMSDRSLTGVDLTDDIYTPDNDPMDYQGHGTHCAGIAGAVTNNSTGIASISRGCKIMPLRIGFRTSDGNGSGYSDWMGRAFIYAADHGASAASLSFGTSGSLVVDGALYAYRNGVVVCNAAGNDNDEIPGALGMQPWVLKVASVNDLDQKASYSTYGSWINISSPGGDQSAGRAGILSTIVNPSAFYSGQLYVSFQGTSMACPLVAGLAGLVKSRFPTMTPPDIIMQICATADNIDGVNPAFAGKLGHGRINAQNAVTSVASAMLPDLSFSSVSFSDAVGNNNGKVDPGETIEMTVFFKNDWDDATNTSATISTTAWGINITKASANYGTIPGIRDIDNSTKGNSSDKFIFTVSPDSIPRSVTLTVSVTADNAYSKNFDITVSILPSLLFVDDDDGGVNVEQYYTNSFSNLGLVCDSWNYAAQGSLTAGQLSAYKTVVWGCEWAFPSLDAADRAAIGGFLDGGGQLFVSGQDIGWDMCDAGGTEYGLSGGVSKTWYENYFKAQYQADNAGTTTLNGVASDPIGNGLTVGFTEPLRAAGEQYPDVVAPLTGAQSVFQYSSGSGAIRYASTHKVVYFSFGGFEAISSPTIRDTVMGRIFNWFNGFQLQHTPLKDTESPDPQLVHVNVTSGSSITSVNLYWDTDGSFPFNKVTMQAIGGGVYEGYIPGQTSATVQYGIIVTTANGCMPYKLYSYKVGVDAIAPVFISADSLFGTLTTTGIYSAAASASDNIAVDTNRTYIVFKVNGSSLDSTRLPRVAPDTFSGTFDVHSLVSQLHNGDVVSYYYSIQDASSIHNYTRYPTVGFCSFTVGRQLIDNFNTVRPGWNYGLSWGYESASGRSYISDSPPAGTQYLANTENTLTLTQPFDLSGYTTAKMYFYRLQQLAAGDTLYVEYQKGVEGWITARKMYGGGLPTWKKDSVDLPGSSSATAIRLRLKSDGVTQSNGMLVDDIEVVGGTPIVGVKDNEAILTPRSFALLQNYPNPFNPSTIIQYDLPKNTMVSLKIFDLLGRDVMSLVDKHQEAGTHRVVFDGANLPSGIYFYRLTAGDFVSSRKMLLLK